MKMKSIVNWVGVIIGIFGLILTIKNFSGANEWIGIIVIAICCFIIYIFGIRGLIQNKE